ncbi:hypothetical protein JCM10207_007794 [Rhodosporidiobolus poonsookiae]
MSTLPTGECLMCGTKTVQRCSACGSAGLDLFFCSAEHQKLLWPVHRDICGANSNPFRWPPLSREEVDDAVQNSAVQVPDSGSLRDVMSVMRGLTAPFPAVLHWLSGDASVPVRNRNNIHGLLGAVRSHEYDRMMLEPGDVNLHVVGRRTFSLRHCTALSEWTDVAGHESKNWFTPLLHHFTAFTTLDYLERTSSGEEKRRYRAMGVQKHAQIATFLRAVVLPQLDTEAAAAALTAWDLVPAQLGNDRDAD